MRAGSLTHRGLLHELDSNQRFSTHIQQLDVLIVIAAVIALNQLAY
jgi:hypothetical protein